MIARLRFLLPFHLMLRSGEVLEPIRISMSGYDAEVMPPYRAALDESATEPFSDVPASTVIDGLRPAEIQDTGTLLVDDQPGIVANALEIIFRRDSFDRLPGEKEPPDAILEGVVNEVIRRVRVTLQVPGAKPVERFRVKEKGFPAYNGRALSILSIRSFST